MSDSILSTNSRERSRQIENIRRVAHGGKVEKKIFVQMEDVEEKKKRQEQILKEREEKSNRSDVLKEARTPWFCPSCTKTMKSHLDDKMYRLYNHCFDCQVKFETKLRAKGTFENWERQKVLKNKLSWIDDMILSVENWKEEASKPYEIQESVGVQEIELEKEKWSQNTEQVEKMATEALEEYSKMREETQKELESIEI
jgi:pyruvate-formate lyase